jgi:cytosine/adenosine deaminase-related metal-dependent hydrolase
MLLRARVLLPVSQPPIADGAVAIAGNRVRQIGPWQELARHHSGPVVDLGDTLLLPGLVNAHCHLDYTSTAGQIAPARRFTDWLKLMTAAKTGLTFSDFAESWLKGAQMLLRSGVTTVCDIEMAPELLPDVWSATPLRVLSCLEMTGIKSGRPPAEILRDAMDVLNSLPAGRSRGGLSPHAPYSTAPELLRLAAQTARRRRLRVVTHVAESDQEFDMFTHGRGEMFDWLKRSRRDMSDCGLGTPVQHMERQDALGENLLAIHVNYLGAGDAALLGRRHVHVVHCPRSHAYFKHAPFPLAQLTAARVNICLGTDSLVSVRTTRKRSAELNLFDEMREIAARQPSLAPEKILRMATVNGARALGMSGQAGELRPDAFADLIGIPYDGKPADACEHAVQHRGDVAASMINGEWAFAPPV